jgi:hypothetical protein
MYSLNATSKAFVAANEIKQSTDNSDLRTAVDAYFASLGANAIVITDDVDPAAEEIIILDDDNPINAAITELTAISKKSKLESISIACGDLIDKLRRISDLVS